MPSAGCCRASVPGTPSVVMHSFPQPWALRAGVLCLHPPAFPSCWVVPEALAGALGLPAAFSLGVCAFPQAELSHAYYSMYSKGNGKGEQ